MLQKITKKPLSIFFVELKSAVNNKDIYDINFLLQCKFEQLHIRCEISQCSKCERYYQKIASDKRDALNALEIMLLPNV